MKHTILTFLLLSSVICLAGGSPQPTSKQIQELIHSLPGFEQIQADFALTEDSAPANEKKREANIRLDKAGKDFKRLRSDLQVGTSIFDYPGLLALSRPRYIESDNKYALVLGVPSDNVRTNGQGTLKDAFEVVFDNHGIITAIKPVIAAL